jgi:hypothetical protein
MSDFLELLNKKEDLHPELAGCIQENGTIGRLIHHPLLVHLFYNERLNAYLNKLYQERTAYVAACLREQSYHQYVFIHERPYRLDAFGEIESYLEPKDYWSLLHDMWVDSENIHENADDWYEYLTRVIPHKDFFMGEEDREFFNKLPETFAVYQGDTGHEEWSWSLSKKTAEWFARRFAYDGEIRPVVERTVNKADVFAYTNQRNEREIIIIPNE